MFLCSPQSQSETAIDCTIKSCFVQTSNTKKTPERKIPKKKRRKKWQKEKKKGTFSIIFIIFCIFFYWKKSSRPTQQSAGKNNKATTSKKKKKKKKKQEEKFCLFLLFFSFWPANALVLVLGLAKTRSGAPTRRSVSPESNPHYCVHGKEAKQQQQHQNYKKPLKNAHTHTHTQQKGKKKKENFFPMAQKKVEGNFSFVSSGGRESPPPLRVHFFLCTFRSVLLSTCSNTNSPSNIFTQFLAFFFSF